MSLSFSRLLAVMVTGLSAASAQVLVPHTHTDDDERVQLENVIVTAHPYAHDQTDLAQPTSVLSGRKLSLQQAPTLGELLSGEPGVSSTYFGPGASRPIIRGLGGNRVAVLQNGVGTIDASATSPDHAVALDPLLVERVEVVRGPASLLYGGSAIGGTVNVISHRIPTAAAGAALNGRVETRVGSVDDETSGGLVLEGGAGPLAWHLDGFKRESGDVGLPDGATLENTAIRSDGGAVGLSFVPEFGYLGVGYERFNTLYGVPGDEGVRIDLRQRTQRAEGEWRRPNARVHTLSFKVAHSDYRHQELEGDEVGTVFTNDGYDAHVEGLHGEIAGFTGALGVQLTQSDFEAVGDEAFLPPTTTEEQSLFAFEERAWGEFTLQFGARVTGQDIAVRDESGRTSDDHSSSFSVGGVWKIAPAWSLGINLNHAERLPNAQERYADGPHAGTNAYEIGDATLGTETARGIDLTLRRQLGWVTGSVSVFTTRFAGYIYEDPTGAQEDGLDVYVYRQTDAKFYGSEAEAIFHLHASERHALDLTVATDLVRARDTSTSADLPRITPRRSRIELEWRIDALTLSGSVQRVETQHRVAPGETSTPGYTLVNASASYRLLAGRTTWDVFARATNLTDALARVHTSFLKDDAPLPGRNFSTGIRLSF